MSNLIFRTFPSGEGIVTPLTVTLLNRGSVPRIWTYLPSPSSRSSETLGRRPTASATFVLGRLVMTRDGSTWTILSAVRSMLMASTSPNCRSPSTVTTSLVLSTCRTASTVTAPPLFTTATVSAV